MWLNLVRKRRCAGESPSSFHDTNICGDKCPAPPRHTAASNGVLSSFPIGCVDSELSNRVDFQRDSINFTPPSCCDEWLGEAPSSVCVTCTFTWLIRAVKYPRTIEPAVYPALECSERSTRLVRSTEHEASLCLSFVRPCLLLSPEFPFVSYHPSRDHSGLFALQR